MKDTSGAALLLRWSVGSMLGGGVGIVAGELLTRIMLRHDSAPFSANLVVLGLTLGLALGLAQALSARPVAFRWPGWAWVLLWTLVTTIGGALGLTIAGYAWLITSGFLFGIHFTEETMLVTAALVFAPVMAACVSKVQHWLLREGVERAMRWYWPSLLGWVLAWVVGYASGALVSGSRMVQWGVAGAAGGAVLGLVTGVALARQRKAGTNLASE